MQFELGAEEAGVVILGEGSSIILDALSFLNETFLGVINLGRFAFVGEVSDSIG